MSILLIVLGGAAALAACGTEPVQAPALATETASVTRTMTSTATSLITGTRPVVTPAFLTPAAPEIVDLPEPPAAPFGRISLLDAVGDQWLFAYLDFDRSGKPMPEVRPAFIPAFSVLSQDGKRAAFLGGKGIPVSEYSGETQYVPTYISAIPQMEVHVADLESGERVRIAEGEPAGEWFNLQWSPDGEWVAGIHAHIEFLEIGIGHADGALYAIRTDGSGDRIRLTSAGIESTFKWAPGSQGIYLSRYGSIRRISLEGTDTRIFPREGETAWMPSGRQAGGCGRDTWFDISRDGRWLATVLCGEADYSIVLVDIDSYSSGASAGRIILTRSLNTDSRVLTEVGRLSLSPDASRILFVESAPVDAGLYLVDVKGRSLIRVTGYRDGPGFSSDDPNVMSSNFDPNFWNAVWSPDGQWIAFNKRSYFSKNPAQEGVFVISVVGLGLGQAPIRITGMMGVRTMQWVPLTA